MGQRMANKASKASNNPMHNIVLSAKEIASSAPSTKRLRAETARLDKECKECNESGSTTTGTARPLTRFHVN